MVKYLGVFIDEKLEWTDHLNYVTNKISSLSGILCRNKALLLIKCKKDIYFALAHSNLIYCIEAYGNVNKSKLRPLITKCNRLLRLLQSKPRRNPIHDFYSSFDTIPFDLLFEFYILKFIHKCLYSSSNVPVIVRNWFTRGSALHDHNIRHSHNFTYKL